AGRLTTVSFPAYSTQNLTIIYDGAGRITSISRANGDGATLTYDPTRKRLSSVATTTNGYSYTISYSYFGDGKLQTMVSPAGTTSYSYGANGRPSSMSSPNGEVTAWTYDHAGRLKSETTATTAGK